MREFIRNALDGSTADYTDIRIEKSTRTEIVYEKDRLKNLENSAEAGGIVRSLVDGGWGIASFNRIEELEDSVEEASRIAKTVSFSEGEPVELSEVDTVRDEVKSEMEKDLRSKSVSEKREVVKKYNDIMLDADRRIESTEVKYTDELMKIFLATSEGTYIEQEIPDVTLALFAVAREGADNIQQAFESIGEAGGFEVAEGNERLAKEAASRAVELLSAKPMEGGSYPVILNPLLAGVFIHEAFGHLCEADHIYKNPRLQDVMELGRDFENPELNVVDEGFIPGLRGNLPYDEEGLKREKTYLIRQGKLNNFLHSRETARKMGGEPTGNGRAISYRHQPIVRMTNTYIEEGNVPFSEMLDSVDRGIYAKDSFGGQTQLEQFTFSAGYGYEIRDGEIGEMVKDVVLTGNVFDTLEKIRKIGDDLELQGGSGGCGKGGQFPLPVTHGSPSILIDDVTIGGR